MVGWHRLPWHDTMSMVFSAYGYFMLVREMRLWRILALGYEQNWAITFDSYLGMRRLEIPVCSTVFFSLLSIIVKSAHLIFYHERRDDVYRGGS